METRIFGWDEGTNQTSATAMMQANERIPIRSQRELGLKRVMSRTSNDQLTDPAPVMPGTQPRRNREGFAASA
jgi:hypothetical protein